MKGRRDREGNGYREIKRERERDREENYRGREREGDSRREGWIYIYI